MSGPADAADADLGVWLGPVDRPLAGRLHLPPDGLATGAVLLCPALGWDRSISYRGLRRLAAQLAAAGLVVLRFDYDGTGDSWGDDEEPGRPAAWVASIRVAAGWLRGLGLDDVAAVGLRHGAHLVATAADDLDAVVMWDPYRSSRALARSLRAKATLQEFHAPPGGVTVSGAVFTEATLAGLGALEPAPGARPTLTVLRDEGAGADTTPADEPDVIRRPGQSKFLDGDTIDCVVPVRTLDDIAAWLVDRRAGAPAAPVAAPVRADAVTVGGVRERQLRLDGLAAVETVPADGVLLPDAPTLVLVNNAIEPRTGPARAWPLWARALAPRGFRVLRVDLSGVGDSPAEPGGDGRPYSADKRGWLLRLAELADDGAGVAISGLCSAGRNVVDALAERQASVRHLLLINPELKAPDEFLAKLSSADPTPEGAVLPPQNAYERLRGRLAPHAPAFVWKLRSRTGTFPEMSRRLLSVAASTDVLILSGEHDTSNNVRRTLTRSLDEGALRWDTVADLDHAMFDPRGRDATIERFTRHLVDRYAAGAPQPGR